MRRRASYLLLSPLRPACTGCCRQTRSSPPRGTSSFSGWSCTTPSSCRSTCALIPWNRFDASCRPSNTRSTRSSCLVRTRTDLEPRQLQVRCRLLRCAASSADILITFRTAYIASETREIVVNKRAIALRYLRGWFWLDAAATLPWDLISPGGCSRAIRVQNRMPSLWHREHRGTRTPRSLTPLR